MAEPFQSCQHCGRFHAPPFQPLDVHVGIGEYTRTWALCLECRCALKDLLQDWCGERLWRSQEPIP